MTAPRTIALLLGIAALGLVMAYEARGHDIYNGITNPVTGKDCCHQRDCRPVDPLEIGEDGEAYTWKGGRFPKRQAQQSPDDRYHICAGTEWMLGGNSKPIIFCFLKPTPGS
jgi:hypothetical protein